MIEMVDIGDKKIEVLKKGRGKTTVVIELGIDTHFYQWNSIIEELSKKTTVLTYYRAGYGNSTLVSEKRTTAQIAEDLNMVLSKTGITENIILIGHSFGGLCVQHFAALYPEKVIGMVLVDPNTVGQNELEEIPIVKERFSMDKTNENWERLSAKTREEIRTEIKPELTEEEKRLPEKLQRDILDFSVNPQMYKAMALEGESYNESAEEIKSIQNKNNMPLKVFIRDKEIMISNLLKCGVEREKALLMENTWHKIVSETAALSTQGQAVEVKGASHCIYRTNPEVIIKAVNEILLSVVV